MEITENINGIKIVERIDFLCKKNNLSRKDLCKIINIPASTIATWKTRNIFPTIDKIFLISKYFNVSLDFLITGKEFFELYYNYKELKNEILSEIKIFEKKIKKLKIDLDKTLTY